MFSSTQPPSSPWPAWASELSWHVPDWVEPTLIVSIMFVTMWFNRRKDVIIIGPSNPYLPLRERDSSVSPPDSPSPRSSSSDWPRSLSSCGHHPKRRKLFGGLLTVRTPNSSRFAKHIHSRILQKFPFLVEMFYWAITFFFYRITSIMAGIYYGGDKKLWDVAQEHALSILSFETILFGSSWRQGTDRWAEWRIHTWFIAGAEAGDWRRIFLTILNRSYAIVHIPATVGFLGYYYRACPTHSRYCTVRRTMSLLNMYAFTIFVFVPTMPPRFLPKEYGFVDTVNAEDAESVWMSGQFVNRLAAMPSMHFGYAFLIGATFVYESGIFRRWVGARSFAGDSPKRRVQEDAESEVVGLGIMSADGEVMKPGGRQFGFRNLCFLLFGIWYPSWMLLTIVATANHYFADAIVAALGSLVALVCNRFLLNLLPLEDWLLWVLRLEKPEPTTGLKQ